ncbi:MAG: tetratricopeptide repeat protein [Elusimicrobiaceae bacterium]|nr:tetratricopeptide repeat protein [Elusimicrobiaceae bacterium]
MENMEALQAFIDDGKPSLAYEILSKLKTHSAATARMTADALRMLGRFDEAIKWYRQAGLTEKDPENKAWLLLGLAACLRTLGSGKRAYKAAVKAGEAARDLEIDELLVAAELEAALALRAQGEFEQSLSGLKDVFNTYLANSDYQGMGYVHWAIGGVYRLQGRLDLAVHEFSRAITLAKKTGDETALGYAYFGLAGASRIAGNIADSEKFYRLADTIFKDSDDTFARAYVNCGLANALRQKGVYDEAFTRYTEADRLYSSINDEPDLGFVKWGLGSILLKRGELKKAFEQFKLAEKLFSKYDEKRGQLLTQFSLACADYLLGNRRQAATRFDRAYKTAQKEGLYTYLESFT